MNGKQWNPRRPWADRPWEQQAVLNSWQLVKKSGLATADSKRALDAKTLRAHRKGEEAKLHIKHLRENSVK